MRLAYGDVTDAASVLAAVRGQQAVYHVAGCIVPWNVPFFVTMLKLAPALAAGATVVVKPAPETPLDAILLAEAVAAAGVPKGVVNIVPGPSDIGIEPFEKLLGEGEVQEVILATNPTVEGEATAHFLADVAARFQLRASRIAHGVPVGGELEYVDGGTLAHALAGRTPAT